MSFWREWIPVCLLLCFGVVQGTQAATPIPINSVDRSLALGKYLYVLEDPTGEWPLTRVQEAISHFKLSSDYVPTLGFTHSALWGYFRLAVPFTDKEDYLLEFEYPLIDSLDVFWIDPQGRLTEFHTGYALPYSSRPISTRSFMFPLLFSQEGIYECFVRVTSVDRVEMPLVLWKRSAFQNVDQRRQFSSGLFIGLVVAALALCLMSYWTFKDISYLFYSSFLLFFSLFVANEMGILYENLFPAFLQGFQHINHFLIDGQLIFLLLLSRVFLELKKYRIWHESYLKSLTHITILALIISVFVPVHWGLIVAVSLTIFDMGSLFVISLLHVHKSRAARFYIAGWAFALLGGNLYALRAFGVIDPTIIPVDVLVLIWLIQFVIISLALGERLIHARRETARMQDQVIQNLKEANAQKDEFLANTSHELRTPLHGIIGLSESLLNETLGQVSRNSQKGLKLIYSNAMRLTNLVNEILDLSRLRHGKFDLQYQNLDVNSLLEQVIQVVDSLAESKRIRIQYQQDQSLPLVWGDIQRLHQVFHTILFAAVDRSEIASEIWIDAWLRNGRVEILCKDRAITLEPEWVKIQSLYLQNNTWTEDSEHLDEMRLFLYLLYKHEATIHVFSGPEDGNRIMVSLPVSKNQDSVQEENFERVAKVQPVSQQEADWIEDQWNQNWQVNGAHILLVDDEPVNTKILEKIFCERGFEVDIAMNGYEALQKLEHQGNEIELVLMDIIMPGISGFDVCRSIRKKYDTTMLPIVFLTGRNQLSDLEEAIEAGGNDFIVKPYSKQEILARVRSLLEMSRENRSLLRYLHQPLLRFFKTELLRLSQHESQDLVGLVLDYATEVKSEQDLETLRSLVEWTEPLVSQFQGCILKVNPGRFYLLFRQVHDAFSLLRRLFLDQSIWVAQHQDCGALSFNVHLCREKASLHKRGSHQSFLLVQGPLMDLLENVPLRNEKQAMSMWIFHETLEFLPEPMPKGFKQGANNPEWVPVELNQWLQE